jgi:uncharacterized membrane protein YfcA
MWFIALFSMAFGVLFAWVGIRFLFKPDKTIRRLQEMKYQTSSQPKKQAIMITRIFGVVLILIGIYFIGVGINFLIS